MKYGEWSSLGPALKGTKFQCSKSVWNIEGIAATGVTVLVVVASVPDGPGFECKAGVKHNLVAIW